MTLWFATLLTMLCTGMNFTIATFMAVAHYNFASLLFLIGTVLTLGILGCLAAMRDQHTRLRVIPPYPVFASGVPDSAVRMRL